MSLSGRDIDDLLAEFTNEGKEKPMSNTSEIDNILQSMGKPTHKKEASSPEPSFIAPINEPTPAPVKAKKSSSFFSQFFESDEGYEDEPPPKKKKTTTVKPDLNLDKSSEKKRTSSIEREIQIARDTRTNKPATASEHVARPATEIKSAPLSGTEASANTASTPIARPATESVNDAKPIAKNKFNDELFASTFAPQQAPSTKAETKQKEKPKKEFDQLLPVMEKASHALAEETALIHETPVRRVGSPPLGSLREKLLSSVKEKAFTTEEDVEYAEAEKVKKAPDSAVLPLAGATASPLTDTTVLPLNIDKPVAKVPQLSVKEDEIPTVEFPLQGKAASQRPVAKAVVIGPSGVSDVPITRNTAPIVSSEVDDTFRDFFGETVAVSREEIEDGLKAKKAGALLRNLFGKRLEETGGLDDASELDTDNDELLTEDAEDEDDDYNSPSDAPEVEDSLESLRSNATLRVVAISLTTALLVYLGLSARTGILPPIPFLDPTAAPLFYLTANLILLLITGLVCVLSLLNGYKSFFKEPSLDAFTAIAFTGALIQSIAFLTNATAFDPAKLTLFAPVAAVALLFNAIGKRMQCTTVCRNFETVSVGYDHSAAYLLKSKDISSKVTNGLDIEEPALLVSRPTALVKGFLTQSFSECSKAATARVLCFVVLAFAVIVFIVGLVQGNGVVSALSGFAAVCTICAPFSATLLQAVPASLLQKNASRVGAVVPGWSAIENLGTVNTVLVNAKDLFLPNSVRLHGIKTFEKERIDLAILYAASVLIEGCDTLRDIFLGVIENKTEMLYKVESLSVEPNFGFSAWIEHTRVIVGNRAMMQRHDINTPSLDYEMKYTKGEKCPIYLAVSGKLFGMFLVSYAPCEEIDEVLYNLSSSGISIIVKSDDFNITSDLIADLYGVKRNSIKVLNGAERDVLAPKTAYLPESEGILTHLGSLGSFAGGLRAAAAASGGLKMSAIVQLAAIIFGILLCFVLTLSHSLVSISLTAVLLFQIAWTGLTIALPFIKKY